MDNVGRSNTAFLTLSANCNVEDVSCIEVIEGEVHIISRIFPDPIRESFRILVSFESLKGI
jgi:hypothetical protein